MIQFTTMLCSYRYSLRMSKQFYCNYKTMQCRLPILYPPNHNHIIQSPKWLDNLEKRIKKKYNKL